MRAFPNRWGYTDADVLRDVLKVPQKQVASITTHRLVNAVAQTGVNDKKTLNAVRKFADMHPVMAEQLSWALMCGLRNTQFYKIFAHVVSDRMFDIGDVRRFAYIAEAAKNSNEWTNEILMDRLRFGSVGPSETSTRENTFDQNPWDGVFIPGTKYVTPEYLQKIRDALHDGKIRDAFEDLEKENPCLAGMAVFAMTHAEAVEQDAKTTKQKGKGKVISINEKRAQKILEESQHTSETKEPPARDIQLEHIRINEEAA
ncbi:MAG: hypothetical protein ACOY3I_04875 [Verrucomicrobiota bacterium]